MRIAMMAGALALTGCVASADTHHGGQDRAERALSDALKGRVAGKPEDCISSMLGTGPEIVDSRTLLYHQGSRVWRNDLEGGCPGLDPSDTLILETHGSQLCRLDTIRVMEPGSSISGRSCRLGMFTPYKKVK